MSAFAAILQGRSLDREADIIGDELASVTGRAASRMTLGQCTLITSPLHASEPAAPLVTASGSVVVGSTHTDEYAFAEWDGGTLSCARDGLGIRLLYVAHGPGTIVVTNVLAAAIRHPRIDAALDEISLVAFLAHGAPPDLVRTCYRDVRVLPPGHTLSVDGRNFGARLWRHWHFPLPDGIRRNDEAILEEYRTRLADAVRERLDPAGTSIFLSGGVDSTTMAVAAADVAAPGALHAITTRYPRYVDDVESPLAQAAAERLGLPITIVDADAHHAWQVDDADPPLPAPLDEPMLADWRDALTCAARHGTVALYGEDGDALLRPPGWQALRETDSLLRIGAAALKYAFATHKRPYLGLRWRERLGIVRPSHYSIPAWLSRDARDLLNRREPEAVLGCSPAPLPAHPTRPEAQAVLTSTTISRHFAATIAPETTRRRIELRFPILDTRLMQLIVSISAIPWCQHKALPRRAYRGRLPDRILDRPKSPLVGFNEGLVSGWRQRSNGRRVPPPADPVAGWIDLDRWTRTLETGTPEAVMAAWRVGALDAWLIARSRTAGISACIR